MFSKKLDITQTWDGKTVRPLEEISLFFSLNSKELAFIVQAPFYADTAPKSPAGFTPRLWDYELVELFLLGAAGQYLEVELGPHGHYLIYLLSGVREVERTITPVGVHCCIEGNIWRGEIALAAGDLPRNISHVNGYGIHGQGDERRYLAATSVAGAVPDFHQPAAFLSLAAVPDWSPL